VANGAEGKSQLFPLVFKDTVFSAPEETVRSWVFTIEEKYNLHPHPEASISELRDWILHIQYDILPTIRKLQEPLIDPTLKCTTAELEQNEELRKREERKLLECAKNNLTDFGNANRFLNRYGSSIRYCPPWNEWFIWDGVSWTRDDKGLVREWAKATLLSIYQEAGIRTDPNARTETAKWAIKCERSHHVQEILTIASSHQDIVVLPQDLDADDWKLCLRNGVYDLQTHTLHPHDPGQLHTRCVMVDYQPGRQCPRWLAFLDRIFQSRDDKAELVEFLQRAAGYTLTGSTQEQCLFLLHGNGANGKSVFLEVLRAVLGGTRGYAKVCDSSTFTTARTDAVRNDIAALAGVRLVTTNENPPGSAIDEALIKELTGEREITARFLFKDFFTYRPRFKIWWAFNHKPRIGDQTWSIWRRIRLVPFEEQIPPEEQDPHLAEDLIATELPGILNWCLDGLKQYQASGLPIPAAIQRATKEYRDDQDILHEFISTLCTTKNDPDPLGIVDHDISESARSLYSSYCQWCNHTNEKRMSQRKFGLLLAERGYIKERTRDGIRWRGVELKQNWSELL